MEAQVPIPNGSFGFLVGKGGRKVKAIEFESGAKVCIDKDKGCAKIRGTEEQIQIAKASIQGELKKFKIPPACRYGTACYRQNCKWTHFKSETLH